MPPKLVPRNRATNIADHHELDGLLRLAAKLQPFPRLQLIARESDASKKAVRAAVRRRIKPRRG